MWLCSGESVRCNGHRQTRSEYLAASCGFVQQAVRTDPEQQQCSFFASYPGGSTKTLARQAKLGASSRVKVPVGKGLAIHPYRVLRLWRSLNKEVKYSGEQNR